jgi:hypothetical protein
MVDDRTFIRVHDGMPDHPKIEGLSDKAFRLLIETWCWSSRHHTNGRMKPETWARRGTAKARAELVDAGLVEVDNGHVDMHDYLDWQRSAEQVAEYVEQKRRSGRYGNHVRWHEGQHIVDPDCEFCPTDPRPEPHPPNGSRTGSHSGSQVRSHDGSQERSQSGRKTSPETETEAEKEPLPLRGSGRARDARTRPRPRVTTTPAELAATAVTPQAYTLVAAWRATHQQRYRPGTYRALAKLADAILADGGAAELIRAALDEWDTRPNARPGLLPHLYDDEVKTSRAAARTPGYRSQTDANIDAFLHTGVERPRFTALPGGAAG